MVTWDVNNAIEYIRDLADDSEMDTENYFIHEVMMHSPYLWIKRGMELAEDNPKVPNYNDALDWMVSEVGEAVGARIGTRGDKWLRNNPGKHREDSIEWEIGQAIMMGILALGYTPMGIIKEQLEKWGYEEPEFNDDTQAYYDMLFRFPKRSEK
jgi:hypothetical protein